MRRLPFGQDVGDMAGVGARAARLGADLVRPDQPRRMRPATRRRADRQLDIRRCRHAPGRAGGRVNGPRLAGKGREALADFAEVLPSRSHLRPARDQDEADFPAIRLSGDRFAGAEPMHVEADIGPAGALRRDVVDAAGRAGGADAKLRHAVT
jgi:hypothetical protein